MEQSEWLKLYQLLHALESRCERELGLRLESLKLEELLPESSDEQACLFKKISSAKLQVAELQLAVNASQPTPTCIQSLAIKINSVTQQLNQLKSLQRGQYSTLLQQEQQLLEELDAVQLNVFSSDENQPDDSQASYTAASAQCKDTGQQQGALLHAPDSPSKRELASADGMPLERKSASSSSANKQDSTLPPEVIAYNKFLARHGNTGGWHSDDHSTFLTVLRRCRGDYAAVVANMLDDLPQMTRQAVIAHCRWHADLTELDMRRRVALVAWRTARDAATTARQAEVAVLGDDHSRQVLQADQQEKEVRQLQKQMVQQWKLERKQQQQQQEQQAVEMYRLQQERERQQLMQRRLALRQQLQSAKALQQQGGAPAVQSPAVCRQAEQQPWQGPSPSSNAQQEELQSRLQQRNQAALERRQHLQAAQRERQAARGKAQQQLLASIQVPRVDRSPGRLLSATAAAAARSAPSDQTRPTGSRGPISSGFVLHVPHKAVPAWIGGAAAEFV